MLIPFGFVISSILFPMSRYATPGLQMPMASSIAFFVVAMRSADSLSILPTGYVAFKSPWKPLWTGHQLPMFIKRRSAHTTRHPG